MKKTMKLALAVSTAMVLASGTYVFAEEADTSVFDYGEATVGEDSIQYRLYDPSENGYTEDSYPLVLFLHGEDATGDDNEAQLTEDVGASFWADSIRQNANPSYVLAPQNTEDDWTSEETTALVKQALDDVIANGNVDENRIYVVGLSSGATESWKLLLEYPEVFAAAIPCAGEVPEEYYEQDDAFAALANTPIWIFHASDDDVVPEAETEKAIQALKDAGNNAIQYDEFSPGSVTPAHEVWTPAFIGAGTSYNWLFEQSLERTENGTIDPSMTFSSEKFSDVLTRVNDYYLGNIWVIDGGDQAAVIDTGMGGFGQADLYEYIRDNVLSNKDATIDVFITHQHGDHTLGLPSIIASGKLGNIYIGAQDVEGVESTMSSFGYDISEYVQAVAEGDVITVGDQSFEILDTPAHTVGSLCIFWDDAVFTGDSIGSGYLWMFSYVDEVIPSAQHLVDEMEARGINKIYTGHFENYETFTVDYAKDILACAQGICDGTIPYGIYTRRVGAVATVNSGSIYFDLDMINTPEEN
jgi:glyoxylase-like metal-dependent hydrolase (beta-lactamase superfamily II)/poly(3-hydroxybutyrate) depolymerase